MGGYQENVEVYLCLSRKELQGLCRKHGLPTNRNHAHLAKSLVSFFKTRQRKNASPPPSAKRSSTPAQAFFGRPCLQALKPKEPSNFKEKSKRGMIKNSKKACKRRTDASEANSCVTTSFLKDNMVNDKGCSQATNQVKVGMITQTSAKYLSTAANTVSEYTPKSAITEGFDCSTSDPGNAILKTSGVINAQDFTAPSQLGFHVAGKSKESRKRSGRSNFFGDSLNPAATGKAIRKVPVARFSNKSTGESSTDSCLVSSNENSAGVPPSFEYFVSSEEGLNLYIDLSLDPMDWIKSLKNKVCIHQKAHDKSEIQRHDTRESGDGSEDAITASIGNFKKESQNKVGEKDTGSNYSLRAIVGENCNSIAPIPVAADGTSGSSALPSLETPVKMSRYLDERNQILSGSCVTYADAPNFSATKTLPCAGDGESLPSKYRGISVMRGSHISTPGGPLNKCISNLDIGMSTDGTEKPDILEPRMLKTDICCLPNEHSDFFGTTGASEKSSLYFPMNMEENLKRSDLCRVSNHIRFCQASPGSGSREIKLLEVAAQHKESSTTARIDDQPASN